MQLRNVSGMNIPRGHRLAALACRVPSPRTSKGTVRLLKFLTNDNMDIQPRHHYFHRLFHCALLRRRCVIVIFRREHSLPPTLSVRSISGGPKPNYTENTRFGSSLLIKGRGTVFYFRCLRR